MNPLGFALRGTWPYFPLTLNLSKSKLQNWPMELLWDIVDRPIDNFDRFQDVLIICKEKLQSKS